MYIYYTPRLGQRMNTLTTAFPRATHIVYLFAGIAPPSTSYLTQSLALLAVFNNRELFGLG